MKEAQIEDNIIKKLRYLGWFVKKLHGNMFQSGMPDLFCAHIRYGIRLIEVKQPDETKSSFTAAQIETFPLLEAHGVGLWIMVNDTDHEYAKLFHAPNWRQYYMKKMLGGRL